jgi:tetratricopeptide (TPR) repeat protein
LNNYAKLSTKIILSCLSITIFIGCSTQKDNATNRSLQNLSARYNYIYNSNVLLTTYQDDLSQTYKDNYDDFLAVYIAPAISDYLNPAAPAGNVKSLDEITQKAQTIISEKNFSNYIDDAYILLGKTNFYNGNYFTAVEYFDYTAKTYKSNKNVFLSAMTWKARSLMQLNNYEKALLTLDTVKATLDSVNSEKAEPLATLAQMSIYQQNYKEAIGYLEQAIKETNKIQSRTRWPYILAQLYEYNKEYDASLRNYTKVENSNAPFEMYFNAKLSKIRINDFLNERTSNRKQQLLKLLKDDKNFDYTDQIYYEVAEDYFVDKDYKKAEEYYKLSAQKSITNKYQKGLSYLKLADLNFKNLGNYVNAKLYYDSAVTTLPKNYSGYEGILKKAENLEYLTQRYQLIADQDTLQLIARLPEQAREKKLSELFEPKKEINTTIKKIDNGKAVKFDDPTKTPSNDKFYFSNNNAISRGFTDFKKRWGNRILEDNWRQSVKSSAQVNQQNQSAVIDNSTNSTNVQAASTDKETRIKEYTALLPLTADQIVKSDQKIIDAYFEIAGFYQQVLQDEEEAVKVYEELLARYPQNNHLEAIYYSLYLGYAKTDQAKSEMYKNMVLAKYPNSVYAKTILDPNFSAKQNALDLEINKIYNTVFDSYEKKDFPAVITSVNETNQRFPGNALQAQYDYLKAIAIGRTQNVDSLLLAFNAIISKYPNDKLINPLVLDHIAYINANLPAFKARKIALIDFDPTEPRFISQRENAVVAVNKPEPAIAKVEPTVVKPVIPIATPAVTPAQNIPVTAKSQEVKNESIVKPVDNFFSRAESDIYYYVISVNDMSLSVSSSRFGIGQFNRGNYAGTGLKHQLLELDEDQLIFVGNFTSLNEVKTYAESIIPQLAKIMKVPATTYKGFYISKENFDKIKNREILNRYIEFFKNN